MSEKQLHSGWLKTREDEKFAPKTLYDNIFTDIGQAINESLDLSNDDRLFIIDNNSNVIAYIDKLGIHTTNLFTMDIEFAEEASPSQPKRYNLNEELANINTNLDNFEENINTLEETLNNNLSTEIANLQSDIDILELKTEYLDASDDDAFFIIDSQENVVAYFDSTGFHTTDGYFQNNVNINGEATISSLAISNNAIIAGTLSVDGINALDDSTGFYIIDDNDNVALGVTSTGIPLAPTADAGTNTTQIATTEFVTNAIAASFANNNAMVFQGVLSSSADFTMNALNRPYSAGDTYRAISVFTITKTGSTERVENGDLVICIRDKNGVGSADDWIVVQTNIDGAIHMGESNGVGSTTQPIYVDSVGSALPITTVALAYGGTGTDTIFANKLIYQSGNQLTTGNHYISSSKVAINSATEPSTETLYVNGKATINDNLALNAGLINNDGSAFYLIDSNENAIVAIDGEGVKTTTIEADNLLINTSAHFNNSPTAPTPAAASNDTKLATTEFVQTAVNNSVIGVKGDNEQTYRTGQVNLTPANIGLGNVTNHQQVHDINWDSANKKITRSKNGTDNDVISFFADMGISLTAAAGSLTITNTGVISVKGNAEGGYRSGTVNLTPADILGTNTSATFWRGDNTWAQELTGYLTVADGLEIKDTISPNRFYITDGSSNQNVIAYFDNDGLTLRKINIKDENGNNKNLVYYSQCDSSVQIDFS